MNTINSFEEEDFSATVYTSEGVFRIETEDVSKSFPECYSNLYSFIEGNTNNLEYTHYKITFNDFCPGDILGEETSLYLTFYSGSKKIAEFYVNCNHRGILSPVNVKIYLNNEIIHDQDI